MQLRRLPDLAVKALKFYDYSTVTFTPMWLVTPVPSMAMGTMDIDSTELPPSNSTWSLDIWLAHYHQSGKQFVGNLVITQNWVQIIYWIFIYLDTWTHVRISLGYCLTRQSTWLGACQSNWTLKHWKQLCHPWGNTCQKWGRWRRRGQCWRQACKSKKHVMRKSRVERHDKKTQGRGNSTGHLDTIK